MRQQSGFTLIELLVSTAIMGVLASLTMQLFYEYKAKAAYTVAEQAVYDARAAMDYALAEPDATYPFVPMTTQNTTGTISDPDASQVLKGFIVPRNTKVSVYFDPDCEDNSCIAQFVEIKHCQGVEYVNWTRDGLGSETQIDHIAGAGC